MNKNGLITNKIVINQISKIIEYIKKNNYKTIKRSGITISIIDDKINFSGIFSSNDITFTIRIEKSFIWFNNYYIYSYVGEAKVLKQILDLLSIQIEASKINIARDNEKITFIDELNKESR